MGAKTIPKSRSPGGTGTGRGPTAAALPGGDERSLRATSLPSCHSGATHFTTGLRVEASLRNLPGPAASGTLTSAAGTKGWQEQQDRASVAPAHWGV